MSELTQEYLKEILKYDPETGIFTRLKSTSNRIKIGDKAGTESSEGYLVICIDYKSYYAHRLAYFYMEGHWPKSEMDHTDHIRDNNIWSNLRACTSSNNLANRPKYRNNTSGFKGVTWHEALKKWRARIGYKNKYIHLGLFNCKVEAAKTYNEKALELFGEFAYQNEIGTIGAESFVK